MTYFADFHGHYMGGYAVVVAKDEEEALEMVIVEGAKHGLSLQKSDITLSRVNPRKKGIFTFYNGDY